MTGTGEWGEFFPIWFSPIPYNHSMAQRFYPLTEAAAGNERVQWYDRPPISSEHAIRTEELSDGLPDTDEGFVVQGRESGISFRITSEELRVYRSRGYPLPINSYVNRLDGKALTLGGLKLYPRICDATNRPLQSIYPSESGWIVWDKDVYDQKVGR
jgi:hypothetical protein